jgi:hypothetical protein
VTRVRVAVLLVGVALIGGSVAACTSSTNGTAQPAPATSVTVASSSPSVAPLPTAAVPSTPAASVTTSAPTTTAASTPAAPTTTTNAPAAPRSNCTSVSVRVIRGSASLGQEIAALQFTNSGSTRCVLNGFPTVTLLLKGARLGQPSQPGSIGTSTRTLAPGDTAESLLHDYTNCQAPLSDEIRVVVPGSTIPAVRPGQLRGCVLRVDKLGPPE